MDRREVDDVEAERGDLRQPRDAVVEGAVAARHGALAARHHLVPGAGARPRPVGNDRDGDAAGQVAARIACGDRLRKLVAPAGFRHPERDRTARRARSMIRLLLASRAFSSPRSSRPSLGLERDILARVALEQQRLAPGPELVGPGFDREQVAAGLRPA